MVLLLTVYVPIWEHVLLVVKSGWCVQFSGDFLLWNGFNVDGVECTYFWEHEPRGWFLEGESTDEVWFAPIDHFRSVLLVQGVGTSGRVAWFRVVESVRCCGICLKHVFFPKMFIWPHSWKIPNQTNTSGHQTAAISGEKTKQNKKNKHRETQPKGNASRKLTAVTFPSGK